MGCESSISIQQNSTHQPQNYVYPQDPNQPQPGNTQQYSFPSQHSPGQMQYYQPQEQPYPNYPYPQYQNSIPIEQSQPQYQTQSYKSSNMPINSQQYQPAPPKRKQSMKLSDRRGIMSLYLNKNDSFLTHHLKTELHLSKYARADLIRRRQILEHNAYEPILQRCYGSNNNVINEYAKKAYFQRIFLEIFQTAHVQFFDLNKSYDQVRQKVAERYLFELYQNKEFIDAGVGKYTCFSTISQFSMADTALVSDSSLFPILRFLKQKYPQVADKSSIQFPEVKQKKQDINLLDNFPSKCYSTPGLINAQTLFSDLKFLIDRSIEEFADFQTDMKAILGESVLTDSKVKKIKKNQSQEYSASPVRRVFIKWAQTIIQRIPNIIVSEAFVQFIRSKSIIANNFYFKSTVQPTTHVKVIDFLCHLLQAAKYQITSLAKRKQFGFYIYDLLRCKTKRSTGQEVCQLLRKMEQTKVTATGKRFQVVRIKNRFKTPNKDLMVNFRYGDIIVGQAQLCIDTSDVSQLTKKTNKFNHYIYQLERGLFGPTCELIMQYEDFQRKDINANLQAQGSVGKRVAKKEITYLKKSSRKCLNGHQMIELKGNHFITNDAGKYQDSDFYCDYCLNIFKSDQSYYYCYFCTITFCHNCDDMYKQENIKQIQLRCNRDDELLPVLNNENDVKKVLTQCPIIIFYLSTAPSSVIYKDLLVFMMAAYKMQRKPIPPIYRVCCDANDKSWVEKKYSFKEYPTSIVFSRDGTPQTTLIGASWSLIQGLFDSQQKISRNQSKSLKVNCWCSTPFNQFNNENDEEIFCLNCGNVNQSDGLADIFKGQDNSRVYICQNGSHCRCLNCGFLIDNLPSKYKDYRGKSYLFEKKANIKLPACKQRHQSVIYVRNFIQSREFHCFNCQKSSILNNVSGAGYCQQCDQYCCSKCIGFEDDGLEKVSNEIINHTAEATAEEGQKCICNRLFKKVYNTRDYTFNILQNKQQGQDRTRQLLDSVYSAKHLTWKCIVCSRTKSDGQLHLACFNCPKLYQVTNKRMNLQICIECAVGTDLLNRQLQQKITQVPSEMVCKKKHPVVRTTLAGDSGEMTFDCVGCKVTYYIYTERYYCKTCRINVCYSCSYKHLINLNPPKCLRTCNQNHHLGFYQPPNSLKFCDGCKITIRKNHFACPLDCGFDLCLACAATPPGIDTTNNRMQHINQQQVKRQMQQYERGWIEEIADLADVLNDESSQQGSQNDLQNVVQGISQGIQQFNQLWD